MRFFWPKSFLFLVLIGFLVIALPLVLVLVNAEISMNRLAVQGARTVLSSVTVIQESSKLVEQIVGMERMARQFSVLKDRQILANLEVKHRDVTTSLDTLERLMGETAPKRDLEGIRAGVDDLYRTIGAVSQDDQRLMAALEGFPALHQRALRIHQGSQDLIVRETQGMLKASEEKRQVLIFQAVVFIFLTVVSITFFSDLISRPIREIDQGIRRLGEGDYTHAVTVTGPKDLVSLGNRLDWLRERLGEVELEKNRFLSHVSHELKTPLASIREGSELLAEGLVGELNGQQREVSKILCKNSIQLQKLIENLLGFSTGRSRLGQPYLQRFPLDRIVEEVLEDQRPAILKKELAIDIQLAPVELLGDRDRIRIVVDNLLSNAVKFTPAGGIVRLATSGDGITGALEVADSGPGIPVGEREKIFQPFYQCGTPSQGCIRGTGLGLSIVREYVFEYGGQVSVGESSLGGALLRVTFPLERQERPA
jgi:two-component system sensor histidine kinase GlrK